MSEETTLEAYADKAELIANVAEIFQDTVKDLLVAKDTIHIVLTGGTVGIGVLAAIDLDNKLDWSKIHIWWGDERFVPASDSERNDVQANQALLSRISIPETNIHRVASSDSGLSLEQAAQAYSTELDQYFGSDLPGFDILFLGVGPDAHIASLFPSREEILITGKTAVAVRNSPKPPPERVSLTLETINKAERVWLVASGSDKAQAIYSAFTEDNPQISPVSAVDGNSETIFFTDEDAAALLMED